MSSRTLVAGPNDRREHRRNARDARDHREIPTGSYGRCGDHDAREREIPVEQISSELPSGGALATSAMAIVPAAPLRFSITTD
jgi:hypothetical protein